jgi:hypothetical protein
VLTKSLGPTVFPRHASRLAEDTLKAHLPLASPPARIMMFRVSPMIERPRPVVVHVREVGTQHEASTRDASTQCDIPAPEVASSGPAFCCENVRRAVTAEGNVRLPPGMEGITFTSGACRHAPAPPPTGFYCDYCHKAGHDTAQCHRKVNDQKYLKRGR